LLPGKTAKQIEKRWINRHDPKYVHRQWTDQEDFVIQTLYKKFGGKWVKIAKHLPGRHSDAIKNRYYSVIRKRLNKQKGKSATTETTVPATPPLRVVVKQRAFPPKPVFHVANQPPLPGNDKRLVVYQLKQLVSQYQTVIKDLNEQIFRLESA
jgi:hypothetical protein